MQKKMKEKFVKVQLTEDELNILSDLRKIAIEDDVFDLDSYDSISRADQIDNAWEGLKIIEKLLKHLPKD